MLTTTTSHRWLVVPVVRTIPVKSALEISATTNDANDLTVIIRNGVEITVRTDQLWFWSEEWQVRETAAEKDFAEGRFASFDNMDDFIADLDN